MEPGAPRIRYNDIPLRKLYLPYDDMGAQGTLGRYVQLPADIIPVLAQLFGQTDNNNAKLIKSTDDGHLWVHVDNEAGGTGGTGGTTGGGTLIGQFMRGGITTSNSGFISVNGFGSLTPTIYLIQGNYFGDSSAGSNAPTLLSLNLIYDTGHFFGIRIWEAYVPQGTDVSGDTEFELNFPGGFKYPIPGATGPEVILYYQIQGHGVYSTVNCYYAGGS